MSYLRDFTKQVTNKLLRDYYVKTTKEECCYTIGILNGDGTASLLDGSIVKVIVTGKAEPQTVCPLIRIGPQKYLAHVEEKKLQRFDSQQSSGYLMEFLGSDGEQTLYVRKLGNSIPYTVPDYIYENIDALISGQGINTNAAGSYPRVTENITLPSGRRSASIATTGGFSASGSHLYVGGFIHKEVLSINNPDGVTNPITGGVFANDYSGENIYMWYAIFKNFDLVQDEFTKEYLIGLDEKKGEVTYKLIDVSDHYRTNVRPLCRAPREAENGDGEVLGLAGTNRASRIYKFFYSLGSGSGTPTIEQIIAFIQELADFIGVTFDEMLALVGPETLLQGIKSDSFGRFFPATHIEYHAVASPIQNTHGYEFGGSLYTTTISTEDDAFCTTIWEPSDEIQPYFQEAGFVFSNDEADEPVMDIVATYNSTTQYNKKSTVLEIQFYWHWSLPCFSQNGNLVQADFLYKRGGSYYYNYHTNNNIIYDPNYAFSDGGSTVATFQNFVTVHTPDDKIYPPFTGEIFPPDFPNYAWFETEGGELTYQGKDFWLESSGPQIFCKVTAPNSPCDTGGTGRNRVYTSRFFEEYGAQTIVEGSYCPFNPGCPYTEFEGECSEATFQAMRAFLQTPSILESGGLPDSGSYNFTAFDGVTRPNFTIIPTDPVLYALWQTAYGLSFGCWVPDEDNVNPNWPGNEPFSNPYEIGRGVMAIKNVNGSTPTTTFIDRPLPSPHDFDHLWRTFLGPSGGRALLIKNAFFGVYVYNKDYVSIAPGEQTLYPDKAPDLISDVIVVDGGTFPYDVQAAKYFESTRLVMYYKRDTTDASGSIIGTKEFLQVVSTPINGDPITFEKSAQGALPTGLTFNNTGTEETTPLGTLIDYIIKGA